jgi:hypothetical protein
MLNKGIFFIFLLVFQLKFLTAFGYQPVNKQPVNYRPIVGLEAKENKIEDEGTREILIKKNEVVKTKNPANPNFRSTNYNEEKNFYVLFGYNNQAYTKVSHDLFGKNSVLNFATPISGKRFGGEMFLGGKFGDERDILLEIGVDYNFAYLELKTKDTIGLHAISPSIRIAYKILSFDDFSFYLGASGGMSILDFVYGDEYSVKYGLQFGSLARLTYNINNSFEVFFGHKFFYNSKKDFTIKNTIYTTEFWGHNVNLGFKIKF